MLASPASTSGRSTHRVQKVLRPPTWSSSQIVRPGTSPRRKTSVRAAARRDRPAAAFAATGSIAASSVNVARAGAPRGTSAARARCAPRGCGAPRGGVRSARRTAAPRAVPAARAACAWATAPASQGSARRVERRASAVVRVVAASRGTPAEETRASPVRATAERLPTRGPPSPISAPTAGACRSPAAPGACAARASHALAVSVKRRPAVDPSSRVVPGRCASLA